MHLDPLHQFKIKKIFDLSFYGIDISITNSTFAMAITTIIAIILLTVLALKSSKRQALSRPQALMEMIFTGLNKTLEDSIGRPIKDQDKKYAKYIFALFLFILSLNLGGMIPGTLAPTSQFAVTFAAGLTVMIVTTSILFKRYKFKMLKSFIPSGTPLWIAPLIFILEFFSYLIRPVSLSIRLGANIIAGHVMLEIIAALAIAGGIVGVFPFMLIIIINLLEFAIVTLQAYIFALLASVYIGSAYHH